MEKIINDKLQFLLEQSARRHTKLCPRQILGVRMGLFAGRLLDLEVPQHDKRLYVFAEGDGCGMGGISVATNCWADRRTMHIFDFGKIAATFVDTKLDQAVRVIPHPKSRERACLYAPHAADNYQAMFHGYQVMPDEELFIAQPVQLSISMQKILSKPGKRVQCECCGEEISNEREVIQDGKVLCRSCAGGCYFQLEKDSDPEKTNSDLEGFSFKKNGHHPIPLITVIGKSGSGKTTFLEKLIAELSHRNYRIATIKHHSHSGFDIDVPGKDSWRHSRAGSCHVVIAAPDKIASYRQTEHELDLDEIAASIHDVDLILVEGYKQAGKPSLEVLRAENSREVIGSRDQCFAVAADFFIELGVPQFDLNDTQGITNLIEEYFLKKQ